MDRDNCRRIKGTEPLRAAGRASFAHWAVVFSILMIEESDVVRMFREFYEGLFPKVCPNCGRTFATLREYILASQRLWPSLNYDIEMDAYKSPRPIGGLAMANCPCGTTMALSTKSMPVSQTHFLLEWIQAEAVRRGLNPTQLLEYLRDEVRKQVLGEPIPGGS